MARLPWLSTAGVFTLVCSCVLCAGAKAQTSADSSKTSSPKTASSTKSQIAKSSGTASTASEHKVQPASRASTTSHAKSNARATHSASTRRVSSRKKKKTTRGQKNIDSERAQEIQEALIREHYLTGEATGTWNQASEDAMRRYQADHGWQSKTVPDSRALISLGLGPSHDHLLNPESAMTTEPGSLHPAAAKLPAADPAPAHVIQAPDSAPAGGPKSVADPAHNDSSPQ